jgi:hypothetical protein
VATAAEAVNGQFGYEHLEEPLNLFDFHRCDMCKMGESEGLGGGVSACSAVHDKGTVGSGRLMLTVTHARTHARACAHTHTHTHTQVRRLGEAPPLQWAAAGCAAQSRRRGGSTPGAAGAAGGVCVARVARVPRHTRRQVRAAVARGCGVVRARVSAGCCVCVCCQAMRQPRLRFAPTCTCAPAPAACPPQGGAQRVGHLGAGQRRCRRGGRVRVGLDGAKCGGGRGRVLAHRGGCQRAGARVCSAAGRGAERWARGGGAALAAQRRGACRALAYQQRHSTRR